MDDDARMAQMLAAIAHPVRLRIVRYVRAHPGCLYKQVQYALPQSRAQATISEHFRILRTAGLIAVERIGCANVCALNQATFDELRALFIELRREPW